jgi:hypothetical protein
MFGNSNRSSVGRHRRVSTPRASRAVLAAAACVAVAAPLAVSGPAAAAVAPAVDAPPPTPTPTPDPLSAITNLAAKITTAKVTLHWTDPTDAGFAGLVVRYAKGTTAPASRTAGKAAKLAAIKSGKPATSVSISGLDSGVTYSFSVWAKYTEGGKTQYAPVADVTTTTKQESTPAACEHGTVICISKASRNLRLMVNGVNVLQADTRFGAPSTPTRDGTFHITRKDANHISNLYGSSMPYSMFFDGGQAIHYSSDFAARGYAGASHGCVNVRDMKAVATLFQLAPLGTTVIVY